MDIEKAFDRVWIDGLIFKLIDIRMPAYIIKFIKNYLTNRTFQVHIQGFNSNIKETLFGLVQGAVLSPILYSIYTYDQPELSESSAALFADDTCIYSSSRFAKTITRNLQKSVKKYINYFTRWKISVNESKFKAVFVTNRRTRQLPTRPLTCGNSNVPWENEAKYLGVIIDKKLTFKPHFDYAVNKSFKASRAIYSLISRNSKLNLHNKIKLVKTAIRPVYTYASPIVIEAADCHIKKFQLYQNKLLRMILDVRWDPDTCRYPYTTEEIHQMCDIEKVKLFMSRLSENFNHRLDTINPSHS